MLSCFENNDYTKGYEWNGVSRFVYNNDISKKGQELNQSAGTKKHINGGLLERKT